MSFTNRQCLTAATLAGPQPPYVNFSFDPDTRMVIIRVRGIAKDNVYGPEADIELPISEFEKLHDEMVKWIQVFREGTHEG